MNETDVKELFASAAAHPAVDRIDVDAAVRGGRRRRRARVAAATAAVVAVLALAGGAAVLALPGRATESVGPGPTASTAGPGVGRPAAAVTDARQLTGRWVAQTIDGTDVSAYRGWQDQPLTATFGAYGRPAKWWEASGACGPWVGLLTVRTDGSVQPEVRGPVGYNSCPELEKITPDVVGAIAATRFMTLTPAAGATRATLTMLDAQGGVTATWKAAPASR
jgi:hypothetical protein